MEIDRRQVLVGTVCGALTGAIGRSGVSPSLAEPVSGTDDWHHLTRYLLERARNIGRGRCAPDRAMVERTIRQFADASGWTKPLVIKWMDTPACAFNHLGRFSLDALLDMGSARFWRRAQPPVSPDEETFERAFEVRMTANELLGVEGHDRTLMAPKLLAKAKVMSSKVSDEELLRVRCVSAQIGWLETSLAEAAAQAVANVELLLSSRVPKESMEIDHQLMVFEMYERGLLATWETPDALICVIQV
jgi:hypothetical protein